jgi:hypothetical protein
MAMDHRLQLEKREELIHFYLKRQIMYIYSVTLEIEKTAEKEWVEFMKHKHIDDVLKTGYFKSCSMRKLVCTEETPTSTFNMQYTVESEEQYQLYQELAAPMLQADVLNRFQGKFSATRDFYKIILEA